MPISRDIETFLNELIRQADGTIEIKRNDLAQQFGCVPSQINYVLSTRFTSECGFKVESRRGGGGYIKITKIYIKNGFLEYIMNNIGDFITYQTASILLQDCVENEAVTEKEAAIMLAAMGQKVLGQEGNALRARIFKSMLISLER